MITAAAEVVFMLGAPVSGTAMPARFNRMMAEAGADRVMVPLEVTAEGFEAALSLVRTAGNVAGAVITAPWKQAALAAVSSASQTARIAGAVNVVRPDGAGGLEGENTDGAGFLAAMGRHGVAPTDLRALVIGAGGAGSAIAAALVTAGARVDVCDLDSARPPALAARLGPAARAVSAPASVAGFGLVVNATATGHDGRSLPHDLSGLDATALVADVIAAPEVTPFLARARDLGARIQTGAEMSAGQLPQVLEFLGLPRVADTD